MFEGLAGILDLTEAGLAGFILVFTRVGAVMALLPGFGERMIPARDQARPRARLQRRSPGRCSPTRWSGLTPTAPST